MADPSNSSSKTLLIFSFMVFNIEGGRVDGSNQVSSCYQEVAHIYLGAGGSSGWISSVRGNGLRGRSWGSLQGILGISFNCWLIFPILGETGDFVNSWGTFSFIFLEKPFHHFLSQCVFQRRRLRKYPFWVSWSLLILVSARSSFYFFLSLLFLFFSFLKLSISSPSVIFFLSWSSFFLVSSSSFIILRSVSSNPRYFFSGRGFDAGTPPLSGHGMSLFLTVLFVVLRYCRWPALL